MSAAELHTVHGDNPEMPFRIGLDNEDGNNAHHFTKDGPVEIWLLAGPAPDEAGVSRLMTLTLPFPNYEIARRHADALALACRLLQNTIDDAHEHAHDAIPTRDDGHRHVVRLARYRRAVPYVAMCEVCMCELVPDVAAWAADRGLLGPRGEGFRISERYGTVKAAIEAAFNREPGLANG